MYQRIDLSLISLVWLFISACGTPKDENSETKAVRVSWPDTDRAGLSDAELPPFVMNEQSFLGSGRFNSVFWLDFEGATVSAEKSFIVKKAGLGQAVIPAFQAADIRSNADRENLKLSIVQNLLPLFPDVDIRFTTTQPIASVYSRVHIGGNNFTGRPNVVGIAPLDLGNRSGDDILFIYSKDLRNEAELVHVIAHEIGHALGARHINSDRALMKPSVALEADSFNIAAPLTDAPGETENSLQVLLNSAGSRTAAFNENPLPEIVDLGAFSSGGVIQYTVLSRENFAENPGLNLAGYRYIWTFDGKTTEGPSVLMTFPDKNDHILELTVANDKGIGRVFKFSVGHRR